MNLNSTLAITSEDNELLRVDNLKVHFPVKKNIFSRTSETVFAVDGISFTLKKGTNLGIVGESGSGKTTTAMGILRLLNPTSGTITFQGKDITLLKQSQLRGLRKNMQIIFQDPYSSLNPKMSVNQIISTPMNIHKFYKDPKERDERVAHLLNKVGLLPDHGERYPHEFSGGQRQRISIARTLALDPLLIIGDEPVSALDVSIQAQIINLLIDLQKEYQYSYIIISHDLAIVEYICDYIAVMYLGKIVEIGPYRELILNPQHPYTQILLSAVPIPDPKKMKNRITLVKGDIPSPINPPPGCSFHPRCPQRKKKCCHEKPDFKTITKDHQVCCFLY